MSFYPDSTEGFTWSSSEVTAPNLGKSLRSEWIKFRTIRSSRWLVLAAMGFMLLSGLIVAYNTRHINASIQANDLTPSATLQGYYLATYLIGALGVIFVSGEYSTGMISSTFTAVPKRQWVFLSKSIIIFGISWLAMTISSIVAFLSAQALIGHFRKGYSLTDPGVLRVVLGTGLFLALFASFGGAFGWIIRKTAGGIVTFFVLVIAFPLVLTLFGHVGKTISEYSPLLAGGSFIQSQAEIPALSPVTGLIVLILWVVAALSVAIWRLMRSDA